MFVLGVTGTPAGGKSTVAGYLQELGATWINADLVARGVLESDAVQSQLLDHFGVHLSSTDGQVDRAKLASLVFGDDDSSRAALEYLESLVHPLTRSAIRTRLVQANKSGCRVTVLDVPLLIETRWDRGCDAVWCVDSPLHTRVQRAADRGWPEGQLQQREANQSSLAEKATLSNWVICNDGTLAELQQQIADSYGKILTQTANQPEDQHCFRT